MTAPKVTGQVDMTFRVVREAAAITVARTGSAKPWSLLLIGIDGVTTVEGGAAVITPDGVQVTVAAEQNRLCVGLRD